MGAKYDLKWKVRMIGMARSGKKQSKTARLRWGFVIGGPGIVMNGKKVGAACPVFDRT